MALELAPIISIMKP
uniref:Uncharacterized protein n=1 Tax=Arundo donax TaxID=35708 RepID=A0A0A9ACI3_ARUDO